MPLIHRREAKSRALLGSYLVLGTPCVGGFKRKENRSIFWASPKQRHTHFNPTSLLLFGSSSFEGAFNRTAKGRGCDVFGVCTFCGVCLKRKQRGHGRMNFRGQRIPNANTTHVCLNYPNSSSSPSEAILSEANHVPATCRSKNLTHKGPARRCGVRHLSSLLHRRGTWAVVVPWVCACVWVGCCGFLGVGSRGTKMACTVLGVTQNQSAEHEFQPDISLSWKGNPKVA